MNEYVLKAVPIDSFSCDGCVWMPNSGDCVLKYNQPRGEWVGTLRHSFGCAPGVKEKVILIHRLSEEEVDPKELVKAYRNE